MLLRLVLICMGIWLLRSAILGTKDTFEKRCLSFTPEAYISNSTRQVLEYVPAGTILTFLDRDPACAQSQIVPADLCRIALSIATSDVSSITFEMWLPMHWSGRLLGAGNGGLGQCLRYVDLAYTTSKGFASFGYENGHIGTNGVASDQNFEFVIDFAWRSLHSSVLAGKKLTNLFYKKPHKKSYFLGCSGGGRQGIKASEMFPNDFDGILAGVPAFDFNNLMSWRANFFTLTGSVDSPDFIMPSTWTTLIHNEILKQCDGLDGVTDGIIEHPDLCDFHLEALACPIDTVTDCLTTAQVEIVRRIFSPLYGEDSKLIYPAMQPGSEVLAADELYVGEPFPYSEDWFKYVVFNDSTWDASTFTIADAAVAEALNPANIKTWPNDLSTFRGLGGKIISYHGGQDNKITSFNTERYYNYLSHGMQASSSELDDFFRFFRISGMSHCSLGPGAWVFGQLGGVPAYGVPFESANNVLAALVKWVEDGVAPDTIEGTKFVDDTAAMGVAFRRRHCRYPLRNVYIGGDDSLPDNWKCLEV